MTTYTGLSAIIALIFCEDGITTTSLSGYDLTKRMKTLHLNFSHQQVYREAPRLLKNILDSELDPQSGKPDRIVYSVKKGVTTEQIVDSIEFSKSFPPEYALAFSNEKLVEKAALKAECILIDLKKKVSDIDKGNQLGAGNSYGEAKIATQQNWVTMLENYNFQLKNKSPISHVA
ncbi:hypothetical protein [Photobacterium kishitanii]|uniref:Uncharacterized protein n=1 Tax=Photobacterium kishitanii TaxID=318456 RepID=A0A2T3KLV7_9GAMM|nr:hypothetical protein [Photobacterium kishitanii]PSV00678.1 hypothetical protein C9J27_05935 [Photobacterium kishitanii]